MHEGGVEGEEGGGGGWEGGVGGGGGGGGGGWREGWGDASEIIKYLWLAQNLCNPQHLKTWAQAH
jgi:hypothetical protein